MQGRGNHGRRNDRERKARRQRGADIVFPRRDDPRDQAHPADRALVGRARRFNDDEISKKIDAMREASIEQSAEIRALREQANETSAQIRTQQKMLDDHEIRVRLLEAGRANPSISRP
jgi:hypothetical protein